MTTDLGASLAGHAAALAQPLITAASDDNALLEVCAAAGWNWAAIGLSPANLRSALSGAEAVATTLSQLAEQPTVQSVIDAATSAMQLYRAIEQLSTQASLAAGLPSDTLTTFVGDLGGTILDTYFSAQLPTARMILAILGIYEQTAAPAITTSAGTTVRHARTRPAWNLSALQQLLTKPGDYARARFLHAGTGQAMAADALADHLGPLLVDALDRFGFSARYGVAGAANDPSLSDAVKRAAAHMLRADMHLDSDEGIGSVISIAAALADDPTGLALVLALALDIEADWTTGPLQAQVKAHGTPGVFRIGAGGAASIDGGAAPRVSVDATATLAGTGGPLAQLGRTDDLHVGLDSVVAKLGLALDQGAPTWSASLDVKGLTVTLRASDGFLSQILPPQGVVASMTDLGLAWSSANGLTFVGGGTGFDVTLPVDLSVGGVLAIPTIDLGLKIGDHIGVQARAQIHATIGPIAAVVDGLGVGFQLAPRAGGGFGNFDVGFAILPPDGIGLTVDAGVVKGGGYLFIDPSGHKYAGVGSLAIHAGVDLTLDIVVLITTDPQPAKGMPSFSLLLLACVQFSPGIALFGGFFLTGLGVLVGIERALDAAALRDGVKSGLLESILFPKDPVADAPKLIGDLDRVFPAAKDRFVFGALAKVSYGTGEAEIFTAELGLAVQLGGPFVLAVLGSLALRWPRESGKEVLVLQLDCVGLWDSGSKLLSIDAALHDSRILTWPLTGGAAFRAGGDVGFLLSIGGYHPHFQAPPSFPHVDRLALSISAGPARVRFETYTAITSNTFQIGAHAEAVVNLTVCSVEGHLGFDALLQFHPFHFEIDIDASLTIKVAGATLLGIGVSLHVSGPNPWHLAGTLHLQILCFKIDAKFDASFGDTVPPPSVPLVDPRPLLEAALRQPRAWSAALPDDVASLISFATTTASPDAKVPIPVHPLAQLRVQQRDVPLDVELDRIGAARVTQRQQLQITRATVQSTVVQATPLQGQFAAAQFIDMSDVDKLARPSFELMDAGVVLAVTAARQSAAVGAALTYETWIFDNGVETQAAAYSPAPPSKAPGHANAPMSRLSVTVKPRGYVVASRDSLSRASNAVATSYTQAQQLARRLANSSPALRGKLQLVGVEEVV